MNLSLRIEEIKKNILPPDWESEIDEKFGIKREHVLNSYTSNDNLYHQGLAWKLSFDGISYQNLSPEVLTLLPAELVDYLNSSLIKEDGYVARKQVIPIPKDWMPSAEDYQKLLDAVSINLLYPEDLVNAIAAVTLAELPDAVEARKSIGDSSGVNAGYDHW